MKKRTRKEPKSSQAMLREILIWDFCVIAYVAYVIFGSNAKAKIVSLVLIALYTAFVVWNIKRWNDKM